MRARRSPPAAAWASPRTGLAPRLMGSDRAVRDAEGAPRRRRGRSRTGWGRGGESACPHPPPASLGPPPSRDSTSLHLLSAAPVASASPAYPRSGVPLPHQSPLAPEPHAPPALPCVHRPSHQSRSWGPALTSAAGPAPRLSPGLKGPGPAAGPRSPSRSSSFPSPCSPSTEIQALAWPGSLLFSIATRKPHPRLSFPGATAAARARCREGRRRRRGPGKLSGGGRKEGAGEDGAGGREGETGEGASHNPSPRSRPGSWPRPRPPTAREGVEVGWRGNTGDHARRRGLGAAERPAG